MEEYRQEYPVSALYETLGVSLSGYYAWRKRPVSEHRRADEILAERIQHAYQWSAFTTECGDTLHSAISVPLLMSN